MEKAEKGPKDEWIEHWKVVSAPKRERELSHHLLRVFKSFWKDEDLAAASKTTRNRYSGSLHALGGYLVARGIEEDGIGKDAHELLMEAIDLEEGPLIYYDNETWQSELDTTCRRLYRYLRSREA